MANASLAGEVTVNRSATEGRQTDGSKKDGKPEAQRVVPLAMDKQPIDKQPTLQRYCIIGQGDIRFVHDLRHTEGFVPASCSGVVFPLSH